MSAKNTNTYIYVLFTNLLDTTKNCHCFIIMNAYIYDRFYGWFSILFNCLQISGKQRKVFIFLYLILMNENVHIYVLLKISFNCFQICSPKIVNCNECAYIPTIDFMGCVECSYIPVFFLSSLKKSLNCSQIC